MNEEALTLCDEILELIPEMPERAEEFAAGVEETTLSIKTQIEEGREISPGQMTALENMKAGLEKWMR